MQKVIKILKLILFMYLRYRIDENEEQSCEFDYNYYMGVSNSENCQNPAASNQNTTAPVETTDNNASPLIYFAFVGGVIGFIIILLIVLVTAFFLIKLREKRKTQIADLSELEDDDILY